jgi:maleylacetate reductase
MLQSGRVAFGAMETVVFGNPAAEAVAEEARRRDAERVFLMVSGTLNRMGSRQVAAPRNKPSS